MSSGPDERIRLKASVVTVFVGTESLFYKVTQHLFYKWLINATELIFMHGIVIARVKHIACHSQMHVCLGFMSSKTVVSTLSESQYSPRMRISGLER